MEIKSKTRAFIVDNFLFSSTDNVFDDEDSFLDKGIIDSTGVLEIVSFLENEFGIEVQDEDLVPENFDSLNNLVWYIEKKKTADTLK